MFNEFLGLFADGAQHYSTFSQSIPRVVLSYHGEEDSYSVYLCLNPRD